LPVGLSLQADYAVCEKMCIPEHAELRLSLGDSGPAYADLIADALARVPSRTQMGTAGALRLTGMQRLGNGTISLIIECMQPVRDVFVESDPDWFFDVGAPRRLDDARYGVDVQAATRPSATTGLARITVTVVGEREAIEVPLSLDVAMLSP
jgi:DsbC/DsbD-like thiol-disulfide interchange protein